MTTAGHFLKKIIANPELAQITFRVEVLERYLAQNDVKVTRTRTVGRVKAATWNVDFGVAPDEKTIHVTLAIIKQKLPEKEGAHWLEFVDEAGFSENYLKMQGSHACIDDGDLRAWGEPETESFF